MADDVGARVSRRHALSALADLGRHRNGARAELAATVRDRVCRDYIRRARDGGRPVAAVIEATCQALVGGAGEHPEVDARARKTDWDALAREATHGDPERMLARVVDALLDDIAIGFDPWMYRTVIGALPYVLRAAFNPPERHEPLDARLTVDGPLDRLRELAATGTLIFAPTHTSNLDSLVVGLAIARAGLPACAYATAKHMYRNRLVGAFAQRLGGYRVDRGLRLDLYNDVLAEYSTALLERGVHSIIFPGATRCRTNEVEPSLKLGLLSTALRARRNRPDVPIWIVPVTINHQVVLEAEWLIGYHLTGRSHERIVGDELLMWGRLRTSLRRLRKLDNRVAIRFGDPLEPQPARSLSRALTGAYRRETVFFATHVAARAVFDLRARDAELSERAVDDEISRVVAMIAAHPEGGSLHREVATSAPPAIASTAIAAWQACHRVPPIRMAGSRYEIADDALLLFYRNRTSHLT
jgi:1-acyl-sn-glycerol-3-phosphate acyltransferase